MPAWLKLVHWGDVTGTNALQKVRALFVIGRPLASAEDVTRQAEALFGAYIPQREYVVRRKQGRIPIVPDAEGNNCIRVDVWEHPHPMGERLRRQITEGAIIQAAGRARAGLRRRTSRSTSTLDRRAGARAGAGRAGAVERAGGRARRADAGGRGRLVEKYMPTPFGHLRGYSPPPDWKKRGGWRVVVFPNKGFPYWEKRALLIRFYHRYADLRISARGLDISLPKPCFCGGSPIHAAGWRSVSAPWPTSKWWMNQRPNKILDFNF